MLTSQEQKIVVSTLNSRKSWLKKSLEDSATNDGARKENANSIKLLESAIQKLGASQPATKNAAKSTTATNTASVASSKPISIDKARFLIAEDNQDSAQLLLEVLQDMGAKLVDVAKDGMQAFDKIKNSPSPYHIILCDWDMPELNGLEVHKKAKASNTLKGAHYIMVTAISESARIKEAIQQGVNDYIVKPVDVEKIERKIKAALELE